MLSKKKTTLACVLLAAAALPGTGLAGMATADNGADVRLTGFARPRVLDFVPGSASIGVSPYFYRQLHTPVDSMPLPWPIVQGGVFSQVVERNRSWASGQPSFLRANHGHGHGNWYEDDGRDDFHDHEHGHSHGNGHGNGHGGTPVPLPAPWVMLMSGLLMLGAARRLSAPHC